VSANADALVSVRSSASSDWDGSAGQAFSGAMGAAAGKADDLHAAVKDVADGIKTFGDNLRSVQNQMADIRRTASAAGLTVNGLVIESPGDGPTRPGPAPDGPDVTTAAVDHYNGAVATFNAHQALIKAYNHALAAARQVIADYRGDCDALSNKYRGLSGANWVLTASSVVGGLVGATMEFNASALRGTATYFRGLGAQQLDHALKANPSSVTKTQWYKDLDDAKKAVASADDLTKSADGLTKGSKSLPLKLGGALAIAGIGYDIYEGKEPVQAVAAGAGGFLAAVGAGAAIGTLIPIPGVGTAVGAIVGAGVGIFTSGAIDSLFENGPDVGAAFGAGVDAIGDTAGAIGDAAGAVGGFVGGLFD
jgi:uncharacterized protein YukE